MTTAREKTHQRARTGEYGAFQGRLLDLDPLPARWSGEHVSLRLCEAMRTLRLMPMGTGAPGYAPCWPAYRYEFQDLLAQQEQGELERTMQTQNRTRLMPSWRDITHMELAIRWPAQFLGGEPHIAVAVNRVAFAYAIDRDSQWVAAKWGGYADTWRQRHEDGCGVIAERLRAKREPVI